MGVTLNEHFAVAIERDNDVEIYSKIVVPKMMKMMRRYMIFTLTSLYVKLFWIILPT